MCNGAVIENKTVVVVKPRPDLLRFFRTVNWCEGGSNALWSPARTTASGVVLVALLPPRRTVGCSGRAPYQRRLPGRLTDAERHAIRVLGSSRSLRSLAADFGVSHETLRPVLREHPNRPSLPSTLSPSASAKQLPGSGWVRTVTSRWEVGGAARRGPGRLAWNPASLPFEAPHHARLGGSAAGSIAGRHVVASWGRIFFGVARFAHRHRSQETWFRTALAISAA